MNPIVSVSYYALTTDTEINESKTYYTLSAHVYTEVASPVVGDIGTYYEKHTSTVPSPSTFEWTLEDISANGAGRDESYYMNKKRAAQAVKVNLEWKNITTANASIVLTAFNPEYIFVTYLDPKEGTTRTSEFYVGNRNSPLYNATQGVWSKISFNIIERQGVLV